MPTRREAYSRHALYYLALVEKAEPHLTDSGQSVWLETLETDYPNLKLALDWSLNNQMGEIGLRLAGSLFWFWEIRCHFGEGRAWLASALKQVEAPSQRAARKKALTAAGNLARHQSDYAQAREFHTKSLEIARKLGSKRGISVSLCNLGLVACDQGDYAAASTFWQEDLAISRDLGNPGDIAISLGNLAMLACGQGKYSEAHDLHREVLAIEQSLGDKHGVSITLNGLGNVALGMEDYQTAQTYFEESLAIKRELKDVRGIAVALHGLGIVYLGSAEYAKAHASFTESLRIRQRLEDKLGLCEFLNAMAGLAFLQKKYQRAAQLYGAEKALREAVGVPTPLDEQEEYERTLTELRTVLLNKETFEAAWTKGRTQIVEQAIEYALEEEAGL